MREILFRGKKVTDGEWTYGYYVQVEDFLDDKRRDLIFEIDSVAYPDNEIVGSNEIYPNTLGQYTGLTDKNGVKIFEGDILHFGDKNYLVFWNDECLQWQMRIRKDGFSFPIYDGQDTGCPVECITLGWVAAEIPIIGTMSTEIVGNIYDNPELLGGDSE